MNAIRNLFIALGYIVSFFTFIGGAMLNAWLLVQAEYGLLPITEFQSDLPISSQQFAIWMFFTLALCCMACAFGVLKMLDRRTA